MVALYKLRFLPVAFIGFLPASLLAQFKGGNDDGTNYSRTTDLLLGRSIYLGGNDDGNSYSRTTDLVLGNSIFLGGNDDGNSYSRTTDLLLGNSIFLGGNDDGNSYSRTTDLLLGHSIFLGGNDDGNSYSRTTDLLLGRSIFLGGNDDGWAMAFKADAPLPVSITDFNGRWQQNDALLFWKTATEINASYFDLERSVDGTTYTSIQKVTAAGNSTVEKNYTYTDANLKKNLPAGVTTVYYRLRSVDKDGKAVYSGVVLLKVSQTSEVEYAVFPNPTKDVVTITASQLPTVEGAYIRLSDVSGKVLQLQKMTSSRQQITVSTYPDGTYFLQLISTDKVVYTQKITIRK